MLAKDRYQDGNKIFRAYFGLSLVREGQAAYHLNGFEFYRGVAHISGVIGEELKDERKEGRHKQEVPDLEGSQELYFV